MTAAAIASSSKLGEIAAATALPRDASTIPPIAASAEQSVKTAIRIAVTLIPARRVGQIN